MLGFQPLVLIDVLVDRLQQGLILLQLFNLLVRMLIRTDLHFIELIFEIHL